MMEKLPEISDAAGRVIIRDAALTVVREVKPERREWLALSRGAQHTGEAVDVGGLVYVADPFRRRDTNQVQHAAA
jgi:hypothetical protein